MVLRLSPDIPYVRLFDYSRPEAYKSSARTYLSVRDLRLHLRGSLYCLRLCCTNTTPNQSEEA